MKNVKNQKLPIDKAYSDLMKSAKKQPGIKELMEVYKRHDDIMKMTKKYSGKSKFFFSVSSSASQ